VVDAVRVTVLQARDTVGATAGMRASGAYRLADGHIARAARFQEERQYLDALGALWQAADLYARVTGPSPPPPVQADLRTTPVPEPAQPADSAPDRVVHDPPPLPVVTPPVTATPPPAAAATAAPPPSASRVVPAVPAVPSDTDAVVSVLRRYQDAYKALDVGGVLQVFPTLAPGQIEQLRRTFAAMTAYEIEAREPRVNVASDMATVRALVARRMVPRVGRPVANEVETEFHLRRVNNGWLITDVRAVSVP
jgi:hypothetical protein